MWKIRFSTSPTKSGWDKRANLHLCGRNFYKPWQNREPSWPTNQWKQNKNNNPNRVNFCEFDEVRKPTGPANKAFRFEDQPQVRSFGSANQLKVVGRALGTKDGPLRKHLREFWMHFKSWEQFSGWRLEARNTGLGPRFLKAVLSGR